MTSVREAHLADADVVFVLLTQFATSYTPIRANFDNNYPHILQNNDADLLVAEVDEQIVGYALATDSMTLFANGPVTELIELFVLEEFRRKGVGRALVQQAIARSKKRRAVEVVVPTRRAGSFYAALGFESTAEYFKLKAR